MYTIRPHVGNPKKAAVVKALLILYSCWGTPLWHSLCSHSALLGAAISDFVVLLKNAQKARVWLVTPIQLPSLRSTVKVKHPYDERERPSPPCHTLSPLAIHVQRQGRNAHYTYKTLSTI